MGKKRVMVGGEAMGDFEMSNFQTGLDSGFNKGNTLSSAHEDSELSGMGISGDFMLSKPLTIRKSNRKKKKTVKTFGKKFKGF